MTDIWGYFAIWFSGAIIVIGLIQWVKNIVEKIFPNLSLPSWFWSAIVPIFSFVASFAMYSIKERNIWWTLLGIWAISQICYESIIRAINKKIEGTTGEAK
jgi:hypothetical protein